MSGKESGIPLAPNRVSCSIWNCDPSTRTLLPLKSASVRKGARIAKAEGPVKNRLTPIKPLLAPTARNSVENSGSAMTFKACASSRNSAFYQDFLQLEEQANPEGMIYVITDNLSSHDSKSTRAWLEDHPRIRHAFIPKGACWLNLQEGWWRIFRRQALAGQSFADPDEIAHATRVATAQLNARARPWIWGRPQPKPRIYRRRFIYSL